MYNPSVFWGENNTISKYTTSDDHCPIIINIKGHTIKIDYKEDKNLQNVQ